MKICTICGNEIEAAAARCPFCEHSQPPARRAAGASPRISETVRIKEGRPTVDEALDTLERRLAACRSRGVRIVRIVHGYGSSGRGGDIRNAVRLRLAAHRKHGTIRAVLPGEDYSELTPEGRAFRSTHPELASAYRTDRKNPGITFVTL